MASTLVKANPVPPEMAANYVYKATSSTGQDAYLYGSTHHSYPEAPMRMGQCVKNLLANSATVVIEADDVEIKKYMATRPEVMAMSKVLPLLESSQIEQLNKRLFGSQATTVDTRLPSLDVMAVVSVLHGHQAMRAVPYLGLPDHGLDVEVRMAARYLNKDVGALETAREQFEFIRAVPAEVFAERIGKALTTLAEPRSHVEYAEQVTQLFHAVAIGDGAKILELSSSATGSLEDRVVQQRNPGQARKIDEWLNGQAHKPVFFALGALHLAGEQGVPALLAAKGYKVQRLCSDAAIKVRGSTEAGISSTP